MRGFLQLVETGHTVVRSTELAARLEPEELAALRAQGIVRESSPPGTAKLERMEEISTPDFVRALRALWGVDPRGLSTPGKLEGDTTTLGWCGKGDEEREVVLVARTRSGLFSALHRNRRTLALVVTGRWLDEPTRRKHGPGTYIVAEALDEVLVAEEGRLARVGVEAPAAPRAEAAPATTRGSRPPVVVVPGAKRWNEVTFWLVDETTVRVGVGKRSYRRTCADLGMAHAQSRQPKREWEMFVAFCEGHGYLATARFGGAMATKKLVSRVRAALRVAFGLSGDPFHLYTRGQGWRTRFVANPSAPRDA